MLLFWISAALFMIPTEKAGGFVLVASLGDESDWVLGVGAQVLEAPDGRLYLLDPKEFQVRILDKQWEEVGTLGRRGKGPGEFEEPKTMAFTPKSELAIFDPTLKRMTVFSSTGEVLGTHSLDVSSVAIYQPHLLNNGGLVFLSARADEGKPVYDVSLFDKDMALTKTLVRVPSTPMDWSQSSKPRFWVDFLKNEMQMAARGMPLVSSPDGQSVITARSDKYELTQLSLDGKVLRKIQRKVKPMPFSEPLKMALFDEVWARLSSDPFLGNNMPESVFRRASAEADVPDAATVIRAIFPFGEGFGVLVNYHGIKQQGKIDLFSPTGEYSRTVDYNGPAYYLWGTSTHLLAIGPKNDLIVLNKFRLE